MVCLSHVTGPDIMGVSHFTILDTLECVTYIGCIIMEGFITCELVFM